MVFVGEARPLSQKLAATCFWNVLRNAYRQQNIADTRQQYLKVEGLVGVISRFPVPAVAVSSPVEAVSHRITGT